MSGGATPESHSRLILYVGKGGVGKTTLAAATGVRAAELGWRTLIVSTDLAHSLGDVLGRELGGEPLQIGDRLWAQEVNVLEEVRHGWGKVQGQLTALLKQEGMSAIQADELAIMPGMEEVAALVQIERKSLGGSFDSIVVDAAPTGETIRLLSMPESFQWYARQAHQWRGRLLRFAGPILGGMLPDLDVVNVLTQLAARVKRLRQTLIDPQRSSYRLVLTPDRAVVKEARRAETYLNLFEYPIDALLVNRVLPDQEPGNAYLDELVAHQRRVMEEIRHSFVTLPLFEAPLLTEEPAGMTGLRDLAVRVFGEKDPTRVMHVGPTQRIEPSGRGYVLRIPMPNVEVDRLDLTKRGDELYVDVGNFRREVTLPLALAGLEPGTAHVRGGVLEIPFEPVEADATVAS